MLNILVIGSGAREAMIVRKLLESKQNSNIYCLGTNKNPYIDKKTNLFVHDFILTDIVLKFINENLIDFAIIGPEVPLRDGISNLLENNDIPCIGPLKIYAQIETSKIFARRFIDKIGLSNYSPNYIVFNNNYEKIKSFSESKKIVVKYDGLHSGKGVKVQGVDFNDFSEIDISSINDNVIFEEKLEGEEFSLISVTDGNGRIRHFPPIQDYKRLLNNDLGPNTGSMGCLINNNNSLDFLNENDIFLAEKINKQIIDNLNSFGKIKNYRPGYRGFIYGSYIKTKDGKLYIIEFNCRLGDPEGIILLNMLKNDFLELCLELTSGYLKTDLEFRKNASLGVYLVPKNYPKKTYEKYDIYINKSLNKQNIVYGNVEEDIKELHLYSLSSRSLFYFVEGTSILDCRNKLYNDIKLINGNLHYRTDIGEKFLNSYNSVGVSIENGNKAIQQIKDNILKTYNENVLGKHGDFGGQYKLNDSVLVSSIDGVGTKSILATRKYGVKSFINLGKDIVNHSVNDILVQGAYPLFFLDYFGTDNLRLDEINHFIEGVSSACLENGKFPILGGETAEMPLVYKKNNTDLVGCIVGLKDDRFFKNKVGKKDIILGFLSDGPHTNGFTLINHIFKDKSLDTHIVEQLLKPHKSYLNLVNRFISDHGFECLTAMAHITGGGLIENIKRVVPDNLKIRISLDEIDMPEWCNFLMKNGNISREEMFKVFNCGIGFVLIVNENNLNNLNLNNLIKLGYIY